MREYFEKLEIPASACADIDKLEQDGGDDIYLQLIPFWDGEDDQFNIRSADDAALLPKLKSVVLFYDDDDTILKEFKKRGIAARWL